MNIYPLYCCASPSKVPLGAKLGAAVLLEGDAEASPGAGSSPGGAQQPLTFHPPTAIFVFPCHNLHTQTAIVCQAVTARGMRIPSSS